MSEDNMLQPVVFEGLLNKPVIAQFDQPDSSSDAGALLLKSVDERLGLTAALAACLVDERESSKVRHSLCDLLRQRVFGIACGYEDNNDAARLREDPIHKLLLGRDPQGLNLASQPTLSRFENNYSRREVLDLLLVLMNRVVTRHAKRLNGKAQRITIDLDATEHTTYGQQHLSFYNGFYGSHCLLPMLGFLQFNDEAEQFLFTSVLRPGNVSGRAGAVSILRSVLPALRAAFPDVEILVRLDGGFAAPQTFSYLESEGVSYVVAMPGNAVLDRLCEPLLETARSKSMVSGASEHDYGEGQYQAGSWNKKRRVVFKAQVTRYQARAARDNPRYVITNLADAPEVVYAGVYAQRGDCENRIKELKYGLAIDRMSCTKARANQVRLILTSAAYVLFQELRLFAAGTSLRKAQVTTLRERLFKLGGWLRISIRRIIIHLPATTPWRSEWTLIARTLQLRT